MFLEIYTHSKYDVCHTFQEILAEGHVYHSLLTTLSEELKTIIFDILKEESILPIELLRMQRMFSMGDRCGLQAVKYLHSLTMNPL